MITSACKLCTPRPLTLQQPYRYINNRASSLTGTISHKCKHYSQTLSGTPAPGPKHCRHAILMTNGRHVAGNEHQLSWICVCVRASWSIGRLTARAISPHLRLRFSCTNCVSCASEPEVPLSVKLHEAVQPSMDGLCPHRDSPQDHDPQSRLPPNFSYISIRRTGTVRHAYLDI
jgi:hypothetical protein